MEISPIVATIIIFGALFTLLLTGVPLAFILGGIGVAAALVVSLADNADS